MALMETMIDEMTKKSPEESAVTKRGRPAQLSWQFLTIGILWCVLRGWISQLDLWRRVAVLGLGSFAPSGVSDQAVYDRLERGVGPMQRLCAWVSQWLFDWLAPYEDRTLVPWARQILALDESTLDSMKRWIADLRNLPAGDSGLLAGRLSGLFDVRRQQWARLDFLPDPLAHCQRHAREMLSTVQAGTLLLFDLGYFCFPWLDDLTKRGVWWISRVKDKCSYTVEHVLVSRDGYGESLIFLGAYRSDQTAYIMRLIRIRYRGQWYSYITNVLDPNKLSGADVVRLYARRWDIELAFRLLKDHLNLRFLWSAKQEVISVQIWATVILAQMLHALQVRVAAGAGVDTFDVSLELLLRHIPDFIRQGGDLLTRIQEGAYPLGIIRPSTRTRIEVPTIEREDIIPPPIDLVWIRPPRYAHKQGQPGRGNQKSRKKKEPGVVDATPVKAQAA
jgi:Transposase DDE domain